MKFLDRFPLQLSFIFILAGIFWIIPLFTIGTFDDGLFYSSISRNLVTEPGQSIWVLKVSNALDPAFHGHPPMAFWLESIFFRIFGDQIWIEKVYSLIMLLLSLLLFYKVQQKLSGQQKGQNYIFLLLMIPLMSWAFANNMLENTLIPFILSAIFFYLKAQEDNSKKYFYLSLVSLLIFGGFLVKGPVALFLWMSPLAYYFYDIRKKITPILKDSIFIISLSILFFLILYAVSLDAKDFFDKYFDLQIKGSLQTQGNFQNRFTIVKAFLEETIPLHVFLIIVWLSTRNKISGFRFFNSPSTFVFLLFLFSSFPFLLTTKQFGHYLLPAYFFYVSYWLLVMEASIDVFFKMIFNPFLTRIFKTLSIGFLFLAIFLSVRMYGKHSRHFELFSELDKAAVIVGKHKEILIDNEVYKDWKIHAYFYRYHYIDLSTVYKEQKFGLSYDLSKQELRYSYEPVSAKFKTFKLLKHK